MSEKIERLLDCVHTHGEAVAFKAGVGFAVLLLERHQPTLLQRIGFIYALSVLKRFGQRVPTGFSCRSAA